MHAWQTVILAAVQGLAELLPVSSSAHVVVTEKLMGLDPAAPQMTLLLVMLHTGTMLAVIVYFWSRWSKTYWPDAGHFRRILGPIVLALLLTALIGEGIIVLLEHTLLASVPHGQIEDLFSHLEIIAPALAAAGILILIAGLWERRHAARGNVASGNALWIGAVQGLCLPFRGFSRSGATISTALLLGVERSRAENFSFALAVLITPPVIAREAWRLIKASHGTAAGASLATASTLGGAWGQSLFGAACAFIAGLIALKWLSAWLEHGRWYLFGIYCLIAAGAVEALYLTGH